MRCIVHFGGRAPVGCPLRGNRRVSGWLPEAVVCFGGTGGEASHKLKVLEMAREMRPYVASVHELAILQDVEELLA